MRHVVGLVVVAIVVTAVPALASDCDPHRVRQVAERLAETAITDATELSRTLLASDAGAGHPLLAIVDARVAELWRMYAGLRATPADPDAACRLDIDTDLALIGDELGRIADLAAGRELHALSGTGSISGSVKSTADASPVAGDVYLWSDTGFYLQNASTDGSGSYSFTGLAAGSYRVSTRSSTGFVDELYDDIECVGGCIVTGGDPVVVADGAAVTGIDFALAPGGSITGTVTDADDGGPLANLSLWLHDDTGGYLSTPRTDGSGVYETGIGLPAGTYHLVTQPDTGYLSELYDDIPCSVTPCTPTAGTPIVVPDAGTATADFVLEEGGRISGSVTDLLAAPLSGVSIRVHNQAGDWVTSSTSRADGTYTVIDGLATGTYTARTSSSQGLIDELFDDIPCPGGDCTVTAGTPIGVAQGLTTPAVDFALAAGSVIEGTVTDAATGLPIQNVQVSIVDQDGASVTFGNSDASGHYAGQAGLLPGTYFVRTTYAPGHVNQVHGGGPCYPLSCDPTGGTPVEIIAGTDAVVDFALPPGGTVSGTVVDADTGAGILNAFVQLHADTGSPLTYSWSRADGSYELGTVVAPGAYFLAIHNSDGYFNEVYDDIPCNPCDPTTGDPITVTAGAVTTGIDVDLRRGGTFGGRVTQSGSPNPVAGAEIRVYDAAGALKSTAVTDAVGTYAIGEVLATGTYFAKTLNDQGFVDEVYSNIACPGDTCDPTAGTPIVLADGQVLVGRDFGLSAGGSVSGMVTEAGSGDPVAGVEIRIFNGAGAWASSAVTAADGSYTAGGLNTGDWYAVAVGPDHRDVAYPAVPCDGGCDPTLGDPLSVVTGSDTPGVDFSLAVEPLFANGFESGDTSAWSGAVP